MTATRNPSRLLLRLGLLAALAGLPAVTEAASFDCSKASAADEVAICGNPDLSALDSEMAGLWFGYKALPLLMGASGNRQDEADAFLKTRAACGANVSCLQDAYGKRIATLKRDIANGVQTYCNRD